MTLLHAQGHPVDCLPPTRAYDWDEIARHNSKTDCWLVIDGNVYDVTDWIDQHPGGQIICSVAGTDVSALFHSSHFRDVRPVMRRYCIGRVVEYQSELAIDTEFLRTLKARVLEYFRENCIDYRTIRLLRPQVCISILAYFLCWAFVYVLGWWPFVVPMGLISCAMVGGFAHEYAHSTLIKGGNQSNAASLCCSVLWCLLFPFMPEKYFQHEHLRHHIMPMNATEDYEVFALRRWLRLSPDIQYRWFFRYQKYYAPLVYCFYISIQVIEGFRTSYFHSRQFRKDRSTSIITHVSWFVTAAFHIAAPIALVGVANWLICFLIYNMVWQCSTYLVAAVVHMTRLPVGSVKDWSDHVCQTTCNVLCRSRFYCWLSGGFNFQIDHHLLPAIAREHLPRINPIVRKTCQEFGYAYTEYESFRAYYSDHYRYLAHLGSPHECAGDVPYAPRI